MHDEDRFSHCPKCGDQLHEKVVKPGEPARLVCVGCGFVFFLDPKVATGCIVETDAGIALLKRSIEPGYGKWVFPSGYVDRGERVQDAAVRETLEECCLEVGVESLLGVYSYSGRPIVVVVWTARLHGGELQAADECLDARYFAAADIPWSDLAFPSTREALGDYLRVRHGLEPPS